MSETDISKAAKVLSKLGASKGGQARAVKLTPEERKQIARKAAQARWEGDLPIAEHEGEFNIGAATITCAVLPDGKRIITQAAFLTALGRSRSPKAGTGVFSTVDGLPFFLQAKALQPFISNELIESATPIFYRTKKGEKGVGYDALLLPKVAEVYLQFRDAMIKEHGKVPKYSEHIVIAADILIRGLANVGIIALVDEATGYQEYRDRHELNKLLEKYVRKELLPWSQRFPLDYYKEMFRLRGWDFRPLNPAKGPRFAAQITDKIVYNQLPPDVLDQLKRKNPVTYKHGRRKHKLFQFLTEDIGNPHLEKQVASVTTLMRAAPNWKVFEMLFTRAFPSSKKQGDNRQIDMFMNDNEGEEMWKAIEEPEE
jgi:hypothetical protein